MLPDLKKKIPSSLKSLRFPRRREKKGAPEATGRPELPPIVLLHGLGVPRQVMLLLAWRLRRYGRRTIILKYHTLFSDLPNTAHRVAMSLKALGVRECDVVTHSMGGIILRWAVNNHEMPRIRRVVQIAPPNAGSWLAGLLDRRVRPLFRAIFGQAGLQIRRGSLGLTPRAGRLDGIEVGVIAGGTGTPSGKRNLFRIPGDNDGTVAVEETILPGMKDFVLLNCDHTTILLSSQTAHMANLFLDHGVFRPRVRKSH